MSNQPYGRVGRSSLAGANASPFPPRRGRLAGDVIDWAMIEPQSREAGASRLSEWIHQVTTAPKIDPTLRPAGSF
jgi:hypothetical protein